jgi:hypothetical protein
VQSAGRLSDKQVLERCSLTSGGRPPFQPLPKRCQEPGLSVGAAAVQVAATLLPALLPVVAQPEAGGAPAHAPGVRRRALAIVHCAVAMLADTVGDEPRAAAALAPLLAPWFPALEAVLRAPTGAHVRTPRPRSRAPGRAPAPPRAQRGAARAGHGRLGREAGGAAAAAGAGGRLPARAAAAPARRAGRDLGAAHLLLARLPARRPRRRRGARRGGARTRPRARQRVCFAAERSWLYGVTVRHHRCWFASR